MTRRLAGDDHCGRTRVACLAPLLVALFSPGSLMAELPEKAEEIKSHLGFLGYQVTSDTDRIRAKHAKRADFTIRSFKGGMLLAAGFTAASKDQRPALLEFANVLNTEATVGRVYLDEDGDLRFESWFPGPYEKERFVVFIDAWDHDTMQLLSKHGDKTRTLLK